MVTWIEIGTAALLAGYLATYITMRYFFPRETS
jgi:hypothetical protein